MNREGWSALFVTWVMMMLIYSGFLISNVLLGVIMGAIVGRLFSLVPLGAWIIDGLRFFGIVVPVDDLYKVGAATGFLTGFLKFSVSPGGLTPKKKSLH